MDLFDIEREIAEVERVRIVFTVRRTRWKITNTYRSLYPVGVPENDDFSKIVARIVTVVGHGVPFLVIDTVNDRIHRYNNHPKENILFN